MRTGCPAHAHDAGLSGLKLAWHRSGVTVTVVTHGSKLGSRAYGPAVARRLKLEFDGRILSPSNVTLKYDRPNDMVVWQGSYDGRVNRVEVLEPLYPENPAARLAVTVLRDGMAPEEVLLDQGHPSAVFSREPEHVRAGSVFLRFFQQGMLHIYTGADHICFVLGLLLLGGSLAQLLKTVTAFTVAHSITLALAATGTLSPSPRWVEPLIALSIVAVAWENLKTKPGEHKKDRRPYIAFGFGLIHGFGFAGALAEVGLPRDVLWPALGAFNLGVEFGQATIVLAVTPLLELLRRNSEDGHRLAVLFLSSAIGAAGLVWFVIRVVRP